MDSFRQRISKASFTDRRLGAPKGTASQRLQHNRQQAAVLKWVPTAFGILAVLAMLLSSFRPQPDTVVAHDDAQHRRVDATELLQQKQAEPTLTPTQAVRALADDEGFLVERPAQPVVVAYAISLIKCSDKHSTPAGLIDAALTLRHSIHLTSSRNNGRSHYDYDMFAIVHEQAESCSHVLKDAGFKVLIKKIPVEKHEIQDDTLRKGIHKAWCCGHDEFIKLYAYHLTDYPIVVHADMDFLFFQPMDVAFDAMLYSPESTIGRTARAQLPVEFPETQQWPRNITAVMTRDWPQVIPGRKPAYQAGLLIAQPDPAVFDITVDVVRTEKYVAGYGRDNGWGGMGYGVFVGAMAMQGLMAFVYDVKLAGTWVEVNHCRFNHMGMDTLYRNHPAFQKNHAKVGKCRNDRDYCEDCMVTNLTDIYNAHYTMCRKPWACIGEGREQRKDKLSIEEYIVHLDHCLELHTVWHTTRRDLEDKLFELTQDATVLASRNGTYMPDIFRGHCSEYSSAGYQRISGLDSSFRRIPELYETQESLVVR